MGIFGNSIASNAEEISGCEAFGFSLSVQDAKNNKKINKTDTKALGLNIEILPFEMDLENKSAKSRCGVILRFVI
jgi:hypothetical protein